MKMRFKNFLWDFGLGHVNKLKGPTGSVIIARMVEIYCGSKYDNAHTFSKQVYTIKLFHCKLEIHACSNPSPFFQTLFQHEVLRLISTQNAGSFCSRHIHHGNTTIKWGFLKFFVQFPTPTLTPTLTLYNLQ